MAKGSSGLKTLLFVLLALLCLSAIRVCYTPNKHKFHMPHHPSENEQFLTLQQRYTHNLEQTIVHLLEPLVGRNKVRAAVQLDLHLKNVRLEQYTQTKNADGDSQNAQTSVFTDSSEKQVQNLIQKQHISVIVDGNTRKENNGIYQPRTAQEMATYYRLVQSAVGYNAARGDTLEIQNMPFVMPARHLRRCPLGYIAFFLALLGIFLIVSCFNFVGTKKSKEGKEIHFSPNILDQINSNPARAIAVIKNWIYMPPNKKSSDWTPIQKVGITLLALDENIVRQILVALDDNEIRQVAKTMTTLGVIPPQESARVLTELDEAMQKGSAVVGNPARVQQILAESTNEETLKFKDTLQTPHSSLWQELAETSTFLLVPRLIALRPEIAAYILYRLPTQKATDVIQNFQEKKATQVLIHLSHIGHISASTSAKMEQEAIQAAKEILNTIHTPSGTEKTSEILSQLAGTQTGQAVIQELNEKEPFLVKKLTAKLVHFEDLESWPGSTIQIILRHTPKSTVLTAIANASKGIKKAIQQNVPPTLWTQLEPEIKSIETTASNEQIAAAREAIVEIVRTLITQGKIQL